MPRWKLLSKIMCYLAMADSGGEQVDCGKSCWEYTQDSTPSKMSKARDEYTNQCKSTHHIRPLALVEVVIGIIQFTIHTHMHTHTCTQKESNYIKILVTEFFFSLENLTPNVVNQFKIDLVKITHFYPFMSVP